MREKTRRKLDGLQAGERRTRLMLVLAALAATIGVAAMVLQPPGPRTDVEAAVLTVRVDHAWDTGKRYVAIESRLDNGKTVLAYTDLAEPPPPGARVVLVEQASWIGFHNYTWNGRVVGQPQR